MKPGDKVLVRTGSGEVQGTLMPGDDKFYVVKLSNGYNVGIDKGEVKEAKVIEAYKAQKHLPRKEKQDSKLPKVMILHTGGTIASRVDYNTGGTIAQFTPDDLVEMFPELTSIAQVSSKLIRNMQSDDMRFDHFNLIADEIAKQVSEGFDGVIITHGTDLLHYTAAALSFMLQDLPVPVIVVGAQRSSDRGSSDAGVNLLSAVRFAANSDFAGVAVCMHANMSDDSCVMLQGSKVRKMHTSRRDTFRPINCLPIAKVNGERIEMLRSMAKRDASRKLKVTHIKPSLKVGLLKVHPNMYAGEVLAFKGFDGLVVEGTGLGHAPISEIDEFTKEHTRIRKSLTDLSKGGTFLVMASQTIYGRINMDVYSPGRTIQKCGMLGNHHDMTPETAYIKLAWLLSNRPKEVAELIAEDLVGEISERTEIGTFP